MIVNINDRMNRRLVEEYGEYSAWKVLYSAAGYYIGREFMENQFGLVEPGTRESDYFDTFEDAAKALTSGFRLRECFENEPIYRMARQ